MYQGYRTWFAVDAASNGSPLVKYLFAEEKVADVEFVEIGGVSERLAALLRSGWTQRCLVHLLMKSEKVLLSWQLSTICQRLSLARASWYASLDSTIQPRLHLYLKLLHEAVTWTASARRQEGLELLAQAGFGPRAQESGWDTKPTTLVPSAAGLELLVHMRDELGMLPSTFQDIHSLWRSDVLEAALGSS